MLNRHYLHISYCTHKALMEHISFFLQWTFQEEDDLMNHHKLY